MALPQCHSRPDVRSLHFAKIHVLVRPTFTVQDDVITLQVMFSLDRVPNKNGEGVFFQPSLLLASGKCCLVLPQQSSLHISLIRINSLASSSPVTGKGELMCSACRPTMNQLLELGTVLPGHSGFC